MAEVQLIKMHTMCKDTATGLEGTVTAAEVHKDGSVDYIFTPKGLSPETMLPLSRIHLHSWRLTVKPEDFEMKEIPTDMIGNTVTHTISGYKGMVIGIVVHLNGCIHYVLQAEGRTKDLNPVKVIEVDPRSCDGIIPSATPKKEDPPSPEEPVHKSTGLSE